ncbi:MAG: response regulator transcription factor [Bryobacterales bacterium]
MANLDHEIHHPIRVAIADDHAVFLEGIATLLSLEDDMKIVATATNGLEAIEAFDAVRPDVLLLDLRMPGLDGLSALRELSRRDSPTKIIILTASEDQIEYVQAISDGAAGVMLKGSAVDMLPHCIRSVCKGEMWLDNEALPLPADMEEMSPIVAT